MRYTDPKNDKKFADFKKLKYWMPVDLYNGGMEHTTLHLLYSRFWHKFFYDLGLVPTKEPYGSRTSHGVVLAEDGRKMSKSKGNVIRPDEIVSQYGADTLRVYEMFMGPFDQAISWSSESMRGCYRFLNKVWQLFSDKQKIGGSGSKELIPKLHKTVKKVNEDLESMKFNTAVSSLMTFVNDWSEEGRSLSKKDTAAFVKILSPLAPHLAEELWEGLGYKSSVFKQSWPDYDKNLIQEETFQLIIQINGKVRDKVEVSKDISEAEAKETSLKRDKIQNRLEGKKPKKIIYISGKLVNIVV
jgi:leucyl-tRNA synthetase